MLRTQLEVSGPDSTEPEIELIVVNLRNSPHPLGPAGEPIMSAAVKAEEGYSNEGAREWSRFVTSCSGFVVLTPQHNRGYPSELKNALDHLYWEWRGKPVMLISYGGHGGGVCRQQLTQVMEGGLKMKVTSEAGITLPEDYISARGEWIRTRLMSFSRSLSRRFTKLHRRFFSHLLARDQVPPDLKQCDRM
jgi:NAD(P)H-dependent FMN reductase